MQGSAHVPQPRQRALLSAEVRHRCRRSGRPPLLPSSPSPALPLHASDAHVSRARPWHACGMVPGRCQESTSAAVSSPYHISQLPSRQAESALARPERTSWTSRSPDDLARKWHRPCQMQDICLKTLLSYAADSHNTVEREVLSMKFSIRSLVALGLSVSTLPTSSS